MALTFFIALARSLALFGARMVPRAVKSGVLRRCVPIDTECLGYGIRRLACRDPLSDLLLYLQWDSWPTDALALRSGSSHAGSGAVGYLLRLDLGQRGQQGEKDIAHKLVVGGEMRLGVAVEADAAGSKALQVHDGRHHAFAGEAVERPEQHAIELALVSILEQRSELLAVLGALPAALVVDIFVQELVASAGAPLAQLSELVLRILPFVVG
jgi:hypothetical protein